MRRNLITLATLFVVGALVISCATAEKAKVADEPKRAYKPNYEVLATKTVLGVPLQMVRRTLVNAEGKPARDRRADMGILDPANTFHLCLERTVIDGCGDSDFEKAARAYTATKKPPPVAGGGNGGNGGGD